MRRLITIFLFTVSLFVSAHASVHIGQQKAGVLNIEDANAHATSNESIVNKDFHFGFSNILSSGAAFAFNSSESRRGFDTFFLSFFSYFTSYRYLTKNSYFIKKLVVDKRLSNIYPHHDFW